MRFVYMDEAGTSEHEPVTVVVGLIVDADQQLMFAEAAIEEVLGAVPEEFRQGFIFHALEVWNSEIYRTVWSMTDRLAFLKLMMGLPRRLGIPISLAIVRRDAGIIEQNLGITNAQMQHIMAFNNCIARADKYIRENAGLREVGSVVAEDVPEMRRFLKIAPKVVKMTPLITPPGGLIATESERKQGYITQQSEQRVTRIRNSVHFVEKTDDPLLQLADACAFGFRRFFSNQEFGREFCEAIVGHALPINDWAGPASATTIAPGPAWKSV